MVIGHGIIVYDYNFTEPSAPSERSVTSKTMQKSCCTYIIMIIIIQKY